MTLSLTADIDAMLAGDLGCAVTIGSTTSRGMLDIQTVIENDNGVEKQVRVTTLLVRTGVYTLSNGQSVTADGTTYKNRGWDLEDDGNLTRIILSRAS